MNEMVEEISEEEVARRKRAIAGRRALQAAPGVVGFARARVRASFTGEPGAEVREERLPLMTELMERTDATFAQLFTWTVEWARYLHAAPPLKEQTGFRVGAIWFAGAEAAGFDAGTTGVEATHLTRQQTMWLLARSDAIEQHPVGDEFFQDVATVVWPLQAVLGIDRRERRRHVHPRQCPVCGEFEVRGEFYGESMTAAEARGEVLIEELTQVKVGCAHCGFEMDAPESAKLRWLR